MRVVVAGAGGRGRSVAARIIAKQEYAGYWEYLLEEAIYTAPAHPFWGGTALIGPSGELLGIGSLQIQAVSADPERPLLHRERQGDDANMIVPIDPLKPILEDLATIGRPNRPARPWLGLYATEIGTSVALLGVAGRGPAHAAGLREGDIVLAVAGSPVSDLAELFRRIWALGEAGVRVPLTINREGRTFEVTVRSTDRGRLLKGPVMH
jgi:S1-C subfamily serine protease